MLSPMGAGIDAMNAFYESTSNQLFILPLFLGSDIFPADKPAIRYATMTVFAHEMKWIPVIVTLAANVVYTGIAVWVLTRMFNSEKVMFSK